ncbi:MAG TPA: ABC transporter permease [Candidatus Dormibacteraeota bacterium]|nr:ABC transporter permease [Candidatus Dormibacteraeota bacterium]
MNAIADPAAPSAPPATAALRRARPSFAGSAGAEALKLARMGMVWAMLGLALLFFGVIALALPTAGNLKDQLEQHPAAFVFNLYDVYLTMFDTGAGIFLLVVAARLVGMEYSGGTIRVLLARGAGRLRLLLAKLTVLAALGTALLAGFLLLVTAATYATVMSWEGSLGVVGSLPGTVWTDLGLNVLIAFASMAVCVLLGTAAAVLGRSLAFGIGAALALFPLDNFGTFLLGLLNALTKQHFWLDVSTFLLGPNLNALPVLMQRDHAAHAAFATPLIEVDTTHAWLVVAAWAVAFLVVSMGLTWRRDVLQ